MGFDKIEISLVWTFKGVFLSMSPWPSLDWVNCLPHPLTIKKCWNWSVLPLNKVKIICTPPPFLFGCFFLTPSLRSTKGACWRTSLLTQNRTFLSCRFGVLVMCVCGGEDLRWHMNLPRLRLGWVLTISLENIG